MFSKSSGGMTVKSINHRCKNPLGWNVNQALAVPCTIKSIQMTSCLGQLVLLP